MTQMSLPFGEPVRGKRVAIAATTVLPAPIDEPHTLGVRSKSPQGDMVMSRQRVDLSSASRQATDWWS